MFNPTGSPSHDELFVIKMKQMFDEECLSSSPVQIYYERPTLSAISTDSPVTSTTICQRFLHALDQFEVGAKNISQTLEELYEAVSGHTDNSDLLQLLDANRITVMARIIVPCLQEANSRDVPDDLSYVDGLMRGCDFLVTTFCIVARIYKESSVPAALEVLEFLWVHLKTSQIDTRVQPNTLLLLLVSMPVDLAAEWVLSRDEPLNDHSRLASTYRGCLQTVIQKLLSAPCLSQKSGILLGRLIQLYSSRWAARANETDARQFLFEQMLENYKRQEGVPVKRAITYSKPKKVKRTASVSTPKIQEVELNVPKRRQKEKESHPKHFQSVRKVWHSLTDPTQSPPVDSTLRERLSQRFWEMAGYPVD